MVDCKKAERKALIASRILTPHEIYSDAVLLIQGERITGIVPWQAENLSSSDRVYDLRGYTLCPGFVEPHIHGAIGVSFGAADVASYLSVGRHLLRYGTTSLLPTVASLSAKQLIHAVRDLVSAMSQDYDGADLVGIHVEGPFLNPARRGAMCNLRAPDREELAAILEAGEGRIRLMTVAPELEGGLGLVERLADVGVVASIGHSDASYEEARESISRGIRYATHLFNAMRPLHHREPGLIPALLGAENVFVELIGDGIHVHPAVMKMAIDAKGIDRVVLITDAVSTLGLPEGTYQLDEREVLVENGRCTLADGTLAGSVSPMNRNIRLLIEALDIPVEHAVQTATVNPAKVLGLVGKGSLEPGKDADIVVIDRHIEVYATMVRGEWRYSRIDAVEV